MKRTILEIYAMAVCFVCVLFFAGFLCSGIYNCIKYIMPAELMDGYQYSRFLSNESFCQQTYGACHKPVTSPEEANASNKQPIRLPEDAIAKKRQDALADSIIAAKHDCIVSLIWAFIFMPIAAVIFLIHWKIGRKAREANA